MAGRDRPRGAALRVAAIPAALRARLHRPDPHVTPTTGPQQLPASFDARSSAEARLRELGLVGALDIATDHLSIAIDIEHEALIETPGEAAELAGYLLVLDVVDRASASPGATRARIELACADAVLTVRVLHDGTAPEGSAADGSTADGEAVPSIARDRVARQGGTVASVRMHGETLVTARIPFGS